MEKICIGHELRSLDHMIKRYFDFSSRKNLIEQATGNNGCIIGYLNVKEQQGKDVYQKSIEEEFQITRSTVSNVLSLMEQKGLIARQSVAQDARLKKIVLTDRARPYAQMMREDALQMESLLTKGFTEAEKQILYGYIQRMEANISSDAEQ